MSDLVQAQ